jgi:hypothetical protein
MNDAIQNEHERRLDTHRKQLDELHDRLNKLEFHTMTAILELIRACPAAAARLDDDERRYWEPFDPTEPDAHDLPA